MARVPFESQNDIRVITDRFAVGDKIRIPATLTGSEAKKATVIQKTKNLIVVQYDNTGMKESFLRVQMMNVLMVKKDGDNV